jgi:hypothetical protein
MDMDEEEMYSYLYDNALGIALFGIAKEYCTNTDDIMEINSLTSENIVPDEILLLVKHLG